MMRSIVGESTILDIGLDTAFRELLQNSDDAEARPVEIRFETRVYLSRYKGDNVQSDKTGAHRELDLIHLKTAVVCGFNTIFIEIYDHSHRSTNGR
jgi:hypothetical protein